MNVQLMFKGQRVMHVLNTFSRPGVAVRHYGKTISNEVEAPGAGNELFEEEEAQARLEDIANKRNKSRLRAHHRHIVHNEVPENLIELYSDDIKFKRRLYGRYGVSSGVDPRICWPDEKTLSERMEYESIAHPYTLQEMIKMNADAKAAQVELVKRREEELANKLAKLETWKRALEEKIQKKEAEALAAKAKKDKLVEEVRRHFGFKVDPRDERFKEMLEKKEKEERKLQKAAKKKAREERMLAKLTDLSEDTGSVPS